MLSTWHSKMQSVAEIMAANADTALPSQGDAGNSIQFEKGCAKESPRLCGSTWEEHPLGLEGPREIFLEPSTPTGYLKLARVRRSKSRGRDVPEGRNSSARTLSWERTWHILRSENSSEQLLKKDPVSTFGMSQVHTVKLRNSILLSRF